MLKMDLSAIETSVMDISEVEIVTRPVPVAGPSTSTPVKKMKSSMMMRFFLKICSFIYSLIQKRSSGIVMDPLSAMNDMFWSFSVSDSFFMALIKAKNLVVNQRKVPMDLSSLKLQNFNLDPRIINS